MRMGGMIIEKVKRKEKKETEKNCILYCFKRGAFT